MLRYHLVGLQEQEARLSHSQRNRATLCIYSETFLPRDATQSASGVFFTQVAILRK